MVTISNFEAVKNRRENQLQFFFKSRQIQKKPWTILLEHPFLKILFDFFFLTKQVNSVNRTAAQMAGFVGNHECVAVINNYVPKEAVFFFTRQVNS